MFMPKVIVAMLSAHLEHAGFTHDDTDALVFTDEEGGPLRYSNWRRRVWLPAAAAAGCAGAGFHDLRRLNATTLVVEGIDVKTGRPGSAMPTRGRRWPSTPRPRHQSTGSQRTSLASASSAKRPKGPQARNLRATSAPIFPRGRARRRILRP
jgi:hypothetical protein